MKPIRWGLRGRSVTALIVILATLLVIATVAVWRAERMLVDLQVQQYDALTTQWVESMRYAVLARSEALLAPSMEATAATPDLCVVEVLDDAGTVIASQTGPGAPPCSVAIDRPVFTRSELPGGASELAAFGLGSAERRQVGRVKATFSTAASKQLQGRMRWDLMVAFIVLGALGALVVAILATSIVRRVRALAAGAERVAAGDLDTRVTAVGADELSQLTHRFNTMTEALAGQRAALDDAAAQLAERESLAAIGRATAVIAHELKNPLGILLGGAEIVANPARTDEARTKAGAIIREEVRRLERTLDELLAYAKPRVPHRGPVALVELCRHTAERATIESGPAAGLAIEVSGDSLTVEVDEQHVAQIVLNLMVNAAQAGANNLTVSVTERGESATLVVTDDGPGVAPELRDQLFRPFVTSKQRGAGLGLAASRRMARDNGGDLRLLPTENTGASFELELPLASGGQS